MNDVLKTSALTGSEMQDIRANIPPVPLRDVTIPADSDDEEAKQDFFSVTLNDLHIPDPLEFSEEDCMSVLSDLYFNN